MKDLKNQFVVSLGDIELTDAQRINIDNAIQKAVLKEIARIDNSKDFKVVRPPLGPIKPGGPKWPFPWGIIIWRNPKLPLDTIIDDIRNKFE